MNHRLLPVAAIALLLLGCNPDKEKENTPELTIPTTYHFERGGSSSVSYQGQKDRLNMLSEIKSYLKTGDKGKELSSQHLLDMFANANSPFESADLNVSSKKLENKTNPAEVEFNKSLFTEAAAVSKEVAENGTMADEGVAGSIQRGTSEKFINVNEKGWEFTQFIEKGLMGSVFYHQIFNVYLSDARTGDDVDNETIEEGKNHTPMEHHWDEAFGYWGVPVDFPNGDPVLTDDQERFWAKYTLGRNELLNVSEPLMKAYITGRAAIVAKDYPTKNAQKEVIIDFHELVTAATAVHYINKSMNNFSSGDTGSMFHTLSEGYNFVKAIQYSPRKKITQADINEILNEDFGTDGDFWTVTMEGLREAKNKLTTAYPELKEVEDEL
ncbi:DUF4856 domain-containing protein [Echinicola soli]|uniref:DUF4856 domain-containing protein n=1 Tax=Echinicola soli TaxID=2591634 RepID=A0A514CL61_9BACT|nr:DUF4856 domain-containing protein [Echinicola soli]QDH80556.1 DUF4856 domain-containing protein [Echinicola soli]